MEPNILKTCIADASTSFLILLNDTLYFKSYWKIDSDTMSFITFFSFFGGCNFTIE